MLKLNTTRTFPTPVTVHFINESGNSTKGTFNAVFKVMPVDELTDESNREKRLLDLVLVSVDSIELSDMKGNILEGEELLSAVKADPSISGALVKTYNEKIAKKNR